MFLKRLISSLVLAPTVLLLIFYGPSWLLGVIVLGLLIVMGIEYSRLIPLINIKQRLGFIVLLLASLSLCQYFYMMWFIISMLLWIFIILAVSFFPQSKMYWDYPTVVYFTGLVVLPVFAQSLINIYNMEHGTYLLVYVLCLVWAADTGAYLTGKWYGKNKLIPLVSPGKSWEGLIGGVFFLMLVALGGRKYFHYSSNLNWYALAWCIAIFSLYGDLFISILKRRCGIKDTGGLIPGHGGMLDRLDSLISALPFFYLGLIWG